jgi:putative spermidine/putrescine transport system substrate-binding protein
MTRSTNRRSVAALVAVAVVGISACGSSSTSGAGASSAATTAAKPAATTAAPVAATTAAAAATTTAAAAPATGGAPAALVDACKKEGQVNLIALPDTWANYKGILQSFRDKYAGVKNPVANPEASSQEELDAVANLKGQAAMPDSIDVSPAKAQAASDAGLWDKFSPSSLDQVPAGLKSTDGTWVAAYYGIMAITTNTTIVKSAPKTFADLKKPEYKGKVALNDDPRKAGAAFAGVVAAALANGGSADDIMPGIKFFAELKKSGNFVPTNVTEATFLSGETPIAVDWSYNAPGLADKLKKANLTAETNFPSDGVYGGYYAQGVVKGSPHPNCAKLWVEHILSDEGALGYLTGGAMPARYAELVKAGKVDAAAKKNLPPDNLVSQIKFMTQAQVTAANKLLTDNWGPMVADA